MKLAEALVEAVHAIIEKTEKATPTHCTIVAQGGTIGYLCFDPEKGTSYIGQVPFPRIDGISLFAVRDTPESLSPIYACSNAIPNNQPEHTKQEALPVKY